MLFSHGIVARVVRSPHSSQKSWVHLFSFIPEGKGTLQQVSPITAGPLLSIFMREENWSTRRKTLGVR